MTRHAQVRSLRRNRRQRSSSHGFTLVELLVVITIIGVLMAMLIPVIGRVREYAHRVSCMNNVSQINTAMISYATTKNHMPPTMWTFADPLANNTTYTLGWAEGMLGYLSRNDIAPGSLPVATLHSSKPYIAFLVCPSDPTKVAATGGPESYVPNGGCENSTSGNPVDWPANGAWSWLVGTGTTAAQNVNITYEYIGRHDGTSTTISMSENLYAPSYVVSGTLEAGQAILWSGTTPQTQFNQATSSSTPDAAAVPSSNHPGGAVVAFCDGSVRFVQQTISYNIYATLMTSYGAQASPPGTAWTSGNAYQTTGTNNGTPLDMSSIP